MSTTPITRIAVVGDRIVTDEAEALEAAREVLKWNGYSEGDSEPLEVVYCHNVDENDKDIHEVWSTWGSEVSRDYGGELIATFTHESDADAYVQWRNEIALAKAAKCEWIELPQPLDFIWFGGCKRGNYPQSRSATITAKLPNGREIEAVGFGNSPYLRDTHSPAALAAAVTDLIEELKKPEPEAEDSDSEDDGD